MTDDPFYKPNLNPQPPARLSIGQPGELLFEFLRASDHAPIRCELRFNGESYCWQVVFFDRGERWYANGAFVTKALGGFALWWFTGGWLGRLGLVLLVFGSVLAWMVLTASPVTPEEFDWMEEFDCRGRCASTA